MITQEKEVNMLSESDLRELLDFSADQPILSVYLNTVPAEATTDAYRLNLRRMLKDVPLRQDVSVVERYFEHEYDRTGRSVAVFSCAAKDFFRAYPLAVSLPNQIYVHNRPAVKPLADALDSFGGYGVALVDKQGARFFVFHLGELREQEGVLGEAVKHTKQGGSSAFPGRRGGIAGQTHYADEVIDRNMKDAVEFASRFFEENHVRRILIGGTDENVALFRNQLPKAWQSLVIGTFPMSMNASHQDVLARAMQVGVESEQRREKRLIDAVITAAAKGGTGTVGIDNTLMAIHDKRVLTLLVSEGYREVGYHCKTCGYLTTVEIDKCPFCGSEFEKLPDAIEHAVMDVMRNGGDIEIIRNEPALDHAGKIGAILRY
jgi:peptide chain release factor subunit 1